MRKLLLILLLMPICAFSSSSNMKGDITCFNQGEMIYHGCGEDMRYDDSMLLFKECGTKRIIVIMSECIIKITE